MIIQLALMTRPGSRVNRWTIQTMRLIDGGVGGVLDLLEYAGGRQPRVNPPPPVLDRPLDLHQVLERVAVEGQRDPEVAAPACEKEVEDREGGAGFSQQCDEEVPSSRGRAAGHTRDIGLSAWVR